MKLILWNRKFSPFSRISSLWWNLYPALKIHCWGGFGSQLFALALALETRERLSYRRISIIFHNSGVTRRAPEILKLLDGFEFKIVDDFSKIPKIANVSLWRKLIKKFSDLILHVLISLRFIIRDESLPTIAVKPHTFQIRGHYSHLVYDLKTIHSIYRRLIEISSIRISSERSISIHYRAGDLLNVSGKQPILPSRIYEVVQRIVHENAELENVEVYSENPELLNALNWKLKGLIELNLFGPSYDTAFVLTSCSQSNTFVGTNSKLTLWACKFRELNRLGNSYIPRELVKSLIRTDQSDNTLGVNTY
jgi:hypothetical protein